MSYDSENKGFDIDIVTSERLSYATQTEILDRLVNILDIAGIDG